MARKKQEIALQAEIETQEEWEDMLAKEGLTVVDIYQEWAGPCKAMLSNFRRLKNELGDDLLRFSVAKTDTIDSLEKYRYSCKPCFMFLAGGVLVAIVRGCNSPLLLKTITEQLAHEHKVLEGNAERKEIRDPLLASISTKDKQEEEEEEEEEEFDETGQVRTPSPRKEPKVEEEPEQKKDVTMAIIKPDVVADGRVDEVLEKLKEAGIEVLEHIERVMTDEEAREFYAHRKDEEYFEGLVQFMTGGPSHFLVLTKGDTGEGIIEEWRELLGPASVEEAKEASPESFRATFGKENYVNALHGSDSKDTAMRELAFFFPDFVVPTVPGTGKTKKAPAQQKVERTLALIRPDAMAEKKDEILAKIKEAGFTIAMTKEVTLNKEQAEEFYKEHKGQDYFEELTTRMSNGPLLALALAREDAVTGWREMLGPKEVDEAKEKAPNSLRAQFSIEGVPINTLHGADSVGNAEKELDYFFPMQQTVAVIKPDAYQTKDEIMSRIREAGFHIAARKETNLSKDIAEEFYKDLDGKEYYGDLVEHMSSGPTLFMVLSREDAVDGWRSLLGPTDPAQAKESNPDSLRAQFGSDIKQNAVHGSSTEEQAQKTIKLVFGDLEFNKDGTLKMSPEEEQREAEQSRESTQAEGEGEKEDRSQTGSVQRSRTDSETGSVQRSRADSETGSVQRSRADSETGSVHRSRAASETASVQRSRADSETGSVHRSKADSETGSVLRPRVDSETDDKGKQGQDAQEGSRPSSKTGHNESGSQQGDESAVVSRNGSKTNLNSDSSQEPLVESRSGSRASQRPGSTKSRMSVHQKSDNQDVDKDQNDPDNKSMSRRASADSNSENKPYARSQSLQRDEGPIKGSDLGRGENEEEVNKQESENEVLSEKGSNIDPDRKSDEQETPSQNLGSQQQIGSDKESNKNLGSQYLGSEKSANNGQDSDEHPPPPEDASTKASPKEVTAVKPSPKAGNKAVPSTKVKASPAKSTLSTPSSRKSSLAKPSPARSRVSEPSPARSKASSLKASPANSTASVRQPSPARSTASRKSKGSVKVSPAASQKRKGSNAAASDENQQQDETQSNSGSSMQKDDSGNKAADGQSKYSSQDTLDRYLDDMDEKKADGVSMKSGSHAQVGNNEDENSSLNNETALEKELTVISERAEGQESQNKDWSDEEGSFGRASERPKSASVRSSQSQYSRLSSARSRGSNKTSDSPNKSPSKSVSPAISKGSRSRNQSPNKSPTKRDQSKSSPPKNDHSKQSKQKSDHSKLPKQEIDQSKSPKQKGDQSKSSKQNYDQSHYSKQSPSVSSQKSVRFSKSDSPGKSSMKSRSYQSLKSSSTHSIHSIKSTDTPCKTSIKSYQSRLSHQSEKSEKNRSPRKQMRETTVKKENVGDEYSSSVKLTRNEPILSEATLRKSSIPSVIIDNNEVEMKSDDDSHQNQTTSSLENDVEERKTETQEEETPVKKDVEGEEKKETEKEESKETEEESEDKKEEPTEKEAEPAEGGEKKEEEPTGEQQKEESRPSSGQKAETQEEKTQEEGEKTEDKPEGDSSEDKKSQAGEQKTDEEAASDEKPSDEQQQEEDKKSTQGEEKTASKPASPTPKSPTPASPTPATQTEEDKPAESSEEKPAESSEEKPAESQQEKTESKPTSPTPAAQTTEGEDKPAESSEDKPAESEETKKDEDEKPAEEKKEEEEKKE